jgi:hypothetical protein
MSLSHRQDTNICAGSNSGEYYSLASWDRNKNRDNQRAYVGLTQVSQLIRREYLPIYLSNNQVRIFLEDLRAYGETFLQMGAPHPSKVVSCTGPWESTCSNITSLVIFSAQHPNVEFVFEGSQNSTEVVNKLISTVQDPGYTDEWRDAIDTILEVNLAYLPYFLTTSANAYPEIRITIDKNLSGGNVDNGRRLWVSKFRSLAGIDQSDLDVKICVAKRSHWHTPHS